MTESVPKCIWVSACPYCHRDGWKCGNEEAWVGHSPGDPNFVHHFVPPPEVPHAD